MKQFEGRLYGGRLFAGRLFRGPSQPRPDVMPYGSGKLRAPEKKRRRDRDDDVLLFILR